MTKPYTQRQGLKESLFTFHDTTPSKYRNTLCPQNAVEQKELFFRHGEAPSFTFDSTEKVEKLVKQQKGKIHHQYFKEAVRILELTRERFGNDHAFLDETFGPTVDETSATNLLTKYLQVNRVEGAFKILFSKDLSSSAKMMWSGPNIKYNKPEARKYTMFIRNSADNIYMRARGIQCLANHEIGTHFYRMMNDGLQPWFSDRKKFGLRPLKSYELCQTEEGLATINTILQCNVPYLKTAALAYYTACMSESMTFVELYNHLSRYMLDQDVRWKLVMRVKRGLVNPNSTGGYGGDQCYFEGAVNILRNIDSIDFQLLYAGKLCIDELPRVKRVARLECIRTPRFMRDIVKYKQKLRKIAKLNKLIPLGKLDRANTDLSLSTFGNRTLESPPSLRADSCMYNQSSDSAVNLSSALSVNSEVDYRKDPETGFVYLSPSTSSIQSISALSMLSLSSCGDTKGKVSTKRRSAINRPKTEPNRVRKQQPKPTTSKPENRKKRLH